MKAYKLKFHSSIHIDAGTAVDGPSETFIHSDTLFSALVSAARKFYGDEVAQEFLTNNSIVLSSAFPYYKNEYFLPKPLNYFPDDEIDEIAKISLEDKYELLKEFKKIKFVAVNIIEKLFRNEKIDKMFFHKDFILNKCWRIVKNITNEKIKDGQEEDIIYKMQEVPHIVMDRITNQTQIYYKSEVYFNKNAGLYFLAEVKDELLNKFETILRFLGDEGIGADRTIGKGFFDVESIQDFQITINNESEYYYLLSLYSPTKEEFENIDPKKSYYDFTIRGGWVSNNTLNRKNLRMFVEGSVLKMNSKQRPIGKIWNVLNQSDYPQDLSYDIYRSGQALFLPITGDFNVNT